MAVGVGFYSGVVFVTVFAVVALILLAPVSEYLSLEASEERKIKKRAAKKQEEKLKEWWTGRQSDDEEDDQITVED